MCIWFVLPMFSPMCISVFRSVFVASPFSQDVLEFQSCLSKLLSFTNFLSTPKFLAEILNDIRSALWRALCNISYPFSNKLLTSFLGKILQQLYSDHIFPVGLWLSCESDIYYFPRSCYPVKEIELHWHELFLTNSCWLCFVFRWIQIDCLIICFSYLSIKEKLTLL